eukprot:CAMPEP_0206504540 /NCGR_PEP_ID=MMETSP0324_2-20121206/55554_1 /ASSEMBLY_ACC=CAM_ASM_000836 /TAXON_ID=2866 /ORGANISM="Crypthecodinium cohnii, Strain Seligo" /LENGTH=43 /DNA_ID= /DNA_START= /DNA_END= /DNA_ORIENTATION=
MTREDERKDEARQDFSSKREIGGTATTSEALVSEAGGRLHRIQ